MRIITRTCHIFDERHRYAYLMKLNLILQNNDICFCRLGCHGAHHREQIKTILLTATTSPRKHVANAWALNSVHTRHKGLLLFFPFFSYGPENYYSFEIQIWLAYYLICRHRNVDYDAEFVCFLSVIIALELYSAFIYPLLLLRTCSIPSPSRVKYTYMPDVFAFYSSRLLFHSRGIKYPRERPDASSERGRERERESQGLGYANRGSVRKRERDKERKRMRVLRESLATV